MTRHFLSSDDLSNDEQADVISLALRLKSDRRPGASVDVRHVVQVLENATSGKSVALLFEKPSTRTRLSFEVAVNELGGHPLILRPDELQLGRGETIEDTARVLSRYVQAIVLRTFGQDRLERLAGGSSVPVINALSDHEHPCQALADLMTIHEKLGDFGGVTLAYLGDGNNVAHSLLIAGAKAGLGAIRLATPVGYEADGTVLARALRIAEQTGTEIAVSTDPIEAAKGADVLYTDVWASMGQESEREARASAFREFQLNSDRITDASSRVIAMHCLPAHRGEEITDEAMDGSSSVVWDQAENRLHTQKALLEFMLR